MYPVLRKIGGGAMGTVNLGDHGPIMWRARPLRQRGSS